ncbi:hypothetical protein LEMLEM_LOCUS20573 [Lemmus lemmus]
MELQWGIHDADLELEKCKHLASSEHSAAQTVRKKQKRKILPGLDPAIPLEHTSNRTPELYPRNVHVWKTACTSEPGPATSFTPAGDMELVIQAEEEKGPAPGFRFLAEVSLVGAVSASQGDEVKGSAVGAVVF